ncbi:MAG: hypothetical protein LBJ71_04925, partial [Holosporaceae bacterium]|nr:hypothetical protein [Holosporaceae bacterium]
MIKILGAPLRYKSVLCLNGSLEYLSLKKFHLPVIAADGAVNGLMENGIRPTVVIGDLDSANYDTLKNIKYIKNESQDSTDFE